MPRSGLWHFDSALEPQKPSNKRPKFTFLEMVSYDAAEERGSYVVLEGASVELWSCMVQVLVPVRAPERISRRPGRTHTLPTSAGMSCTSCRQVSGELPGGQRAHLGSISWTVAHPEAVFRHEINSLKSEAVAPSPKPRPRGRNRPGAGLGTKIRAKNAASRPPGPQNPDLKCPY